MFRDIKTNYYIVPVWFWIASTYDHVVDYFWILIELLFQNNGGKMK